MASKIALELTTTQIESLVEQLSVENKIRLVKKLEQETWRQRFEQVVSKIRQRFKENPLSDKEIQRLCEEARQKVYHERLKGCSR